MSAKTRLKNKVIKRQLIGVIEAIYEEYKGQDRKILTALMNAKNLFKKKDAKPAELKLFQDKIEELFEKLKVKKKMAPTLEQVQLGLRPGDEYEDPGDGGGDYINVGYLKKQSRKHRHKGGRKTRRRRKNKSKRKTKRKPKRRRRKRRKTRRKRR